MLNSYRRYRGTVHISKENGSPEGVIKAANMTTAQIAWRLYSFSPSFVTTPNADNIAMTVGNSNTIPKVMTVDVKSEIYELSEKLFGTSGLT